MTLILGLILFAFFLLFFFVCEKNISLSLNIIIISIPSYLLRFSLFGIPTTVLEIMIYIVFLVWFYKSIRFSNIFFLSRKFSRSDRYFVSGTILLFCGVLFSVMNSDDFRTSLGVLKGFFVDPFLFFLVFVSEIKKREEALLSLYSFVLSALFVALLSLYYAICGIFTFDGRLNSFYESPNYLAMYLAPAFLIAFCLLISKENLFDNNFNCLQGNFLKKVFQNKRNLFFASLIFIVVVILTKSFGAFLGIIFALFFIFIKNIKHLRNVFILISGARLVAIFAIFLFSFGFFALQKYEQFADSDGRSSFHSRVMIWRSSVEMIKDSPFLGIGPGTFQDKYLELQPMFDPYLEWAVTQPHNTYLAFYLQSGFLGFLGFMLIISWLFRISLHNDLIFIFLVYFFFYGFVDTLYWKNDLSIIFWMILGVAYVLSKTKFKICS